MRPSEVCILRPCEIDKSGPVWLYRPTQHKTGWRGKARVIAIGPNAQKELEPFTPDDPKPPWKNTLLPSANRVTFQNAPFPLDSILYFGMSGPRSLMQWTRPREIRWGRENGST